MPTATEFEAMARRFDARADEVAQLPFAFVPELTHRIATGPIADVLRDAFAVSARHMADTAERCRELAAECRRRAAACRSFTREVDRYHREVVDPAIRRQPHTYPWRAPWMEYGW